MTLLDRIDSALAPAPQPNQTSTTDSLLNRMQNAISAEPLPPAKTTTLNPEGGRVISHETNVSPERAVFLDSVATGIQSPTASFGFDRFTENAGNFAIDFVSAIPDVLKGAVATGGDIVTSLTGGSLEQVGEELAGAVETNGATPILARMAARRKIGEFLKGDTGFGEMLSAVGQGISPSLAVGELQARLVNNGLIAKDDVLAFNDGIALAGVEIKNDYDNFLTANNLLPDPANPISQVAFDVGGAVGSVAASVATTLVTRNPMYAGVAFGLVQQNNVYDEARAKGFEVADAKTIADISGMTSGALETLGNKILLGVFQTGKVFKSLFTKAAVSATQPLAKVTLGTAVKAAAEEGVIEAAQSVAESVQLGEAGVRDKQTPEQIALDALYAGALGMFGGGVASAGVAAIQDHLAKRKQAGEEDLPPETVDRLIAEFENAVPDITAAVADTLQQQTVVNSQSEPDRDAARVVEDFVNGTPIDVAKLIASNKDLTAVQKQQLLEQYKAKGFDELAFTGRLNRLDDDLQAVESTLLQTNAKLKEAKAEGKETRTIEKRIEKLEKDRAVLEAERTDLVSGAPKAVDAPSRPIRIRDKQLEKLGVSTDRRTKLAIDAAFSKAGRLARTDSKAAQSAVIEVINSSELSAADKGKFLNQIKSIQTSKQAAKKLPDIQEKITRLVEAEQKRKLRSQIEKTLTTAENSNVGDVGAKKEAKVMRERFARQGILTGGDADVTIREIPLSDMEDALIEAASLLNDAKAQLETRKDLKAQRLELRLAELSQDSVPLSNADLKKADIGERLGALDTLKNKLVAASNTSRRLGLNKNSMDVIFDIMDGAKQYTGAHSRVFKRRADIAFGRFLQLKENTTRSVKKLTDELKLKEENFDRIGVYAALQQEGGREKLLATGYTAAQLDKVPSTITANELKMYVLMREKLDSLKPAIEEVMRTVYNKEFKNVKDYFPFMTDFNAMDGQDIQKMFGDDAFKIGDDAKDFRTKDVKKGFTKERKGGRQKIRVDALSIFLNHVENATYLIEMGQDIKELGELALTDRYADIAGDLGQEVTLDWINLLSKKGNLSGQNDWLNTIRTNAGAAVLGFKLSSALIQPTALMDGAAFVGGDWVFGHGVKNVASAEWRSFLKNNLPEIRERVGDDPAYLDLGGDGKVKDVLSGVAVGVSLGGTFFGSIGATVGAITGGAIGTRMKVNSAGFWALQNLDLLAASAVASGAYVKSVKSRGGVVDLNNPDPLAVQEAQLAVRRSQASQYFKDASPMISQGKLTSEFIPEGRRQGQKGASISIDKMILQFQSFLLNRWSLIEHDLWNAGIKKGRTVQALNIATWLVLANAAEYSIRHFSKELIAAAIGIEPPEEKPIEEIAAKQVISNVPFISSFVNAAEYGSVPVPSISLIQSFLASLNYAGRSKSDEKKRKHYLQAAIAFAGLFGVAGTLQAKQTVAALQKKEE